MEDDGYVEESSEKKRRLSIEQVNALEKNFVLENKIVPERKAQLARELGLQPRQVAVWFQNRRARWKSKQIETEYDLLKANYDSLKTEYSSLQQNNQRLRKEIEELKFKLVENTESTDSVKAEMSPSDSEDDKVSGNHLQVPQTSLYSQTEPKSSSYNTGGEGGCPMSSSSATLLPDGKGGLSDDDSSAMIHDDCNLSPETADATPVLIDFSSIVNAESTSSTCLQIGSSPTFHVPVVKMEEHGVFNGEDACDFFSEEQPPTLQWYFSEQWNNSTFPEA